MSEETTTVEYHSGPLDGLRQEQPAGWYLVEAIDAAGHRVCDEGIYLRLCDDFYWTVSSKHTRSRSRFLSLSA